VAYSHILISLTNCRYVTKRHVKSQSTFCVYDILQTSWYPHAIDSDVGLWLATMRWRHVKSVSKSNSLQAGRRIGSHAAKF